MSETSSSFCGVGKGSWRQDAARIVEELFRVTPAESWDMLLDLRENLLVGEDWNKTLDLFLSCRRSLEASHYLPFYRLRTLLTNSLRLEAGRVAVSPLRQVLRRKHRSLAEISRHVAREIFEHDLDKVGEKALHLQVVER